MDIKDPICLGVPSGEATGRAARTSHPLSSARILSPLQGSVFLLDGLPRAARTSSCLPWAAFCRASGPWKLALATLEHLILMDAKKIRADRQVCPTKDGGGAKMRPVVDRPVKHVMLIS